MSNELKAMTDGTFTESEDPNVFYFYRNDREAIGDVGRIPMDFYKTWICTKMFDDEITEMVLNNFCFETSDDGKYIRLTISETGKQKKPNFFKKLFSKFFK